MTYEEVLQKAAEVLKPKCRVCPECNGVACRGEVPGVGAIGDGSAFTLCRDYLSRIRLQMDAVHPHFDADTSLEMFGIQLAGPVMVAPIGGMPFNYTNVLTETEYCEAVVFGAKEAGIIAFTGDGPLDDYFPSTLPVIASAGGLGIPTIKPWAKEKLFDRIDDISKIDCPAFAMDIDSAALVNLKLQGKPAFAKSEEEIREIVEAAQCPFIVKGVMTPESALRCARAGAYAIVVSSHGGRIMQDTLPPVSVLSEIKDAVGDQMKIIVDGGIRSGSDVFKCLALGADAVLIGRPYAIAAHGGGAEGVALYTEKILQELKEVMLMTDSPTLSDITKDKIRFYPVVG
ncbi:MAG: alpha-hydroxy-acid oxidizing protein [Eggerthellaceae bacterium]|nr:alpha-hydroxy-acid oxidizing protein [Eggerthellaceae bacterium]